MIDPALRLETERLILRRLEQRDVERVQLLANEREIAAMIAPIPYPYTLQNAQDWIYFSRSGWENEVNYTFALLLKPENLLIGAMEISNEVANRRGQLGYWIGKPYWRQGYATEAGRRVLEFAFDRLDLNRVSCSHFLNNPASARVMEKLGTSYEGTLRGHVVKWGEAVDLCCYAILRAECEVQGRASSA